MKSNIEKIEASVTLTKVLYTKQINAINGKEFNVQLERAKLFVKASDNWELDSTKDELKKLNVSYKDKYEFFEDMFGIKKSQSAKLLRIGRMKIEDVMQYVEKFEKKCTIEGLDEFRKGDKEVNTTATMPTEKTTTQKPLKFTTDKKGINITITEGYTAEDIKEALKFLKALKPTA